MVCCDWRVVTYIHVYMHKVILKSVSFTMQKLFKLSLCNRLMCVYVFVLGVLDTTYIFFSINITDTSTHFRHDMSTSARHQGSGWRGHGCNRLRKCAVWDSQNYLIYSTLLPYHYLVITGNTDFYIDKYQPGHVCPPRRTHAGPSSTIRAGLGGCLNHGSLEWCRIWTTSTASLILLTW